MRDSSDDGSEGPIIHKAFDKMFDSQDGFPFVIGGSTSSVTDLHPPAVQMFQLWQIYLENVNPLLKLTHTPTLQGQLIEATANPAKIPKPLEALLFSIYFLAIVSLTDDEVQETFKEDKNRLMSKFHRGTQQALINAGFMRSPDIIVLQAFVMYLVSIILVTLPPHPRDPPSQNDRLRSPIQPFHRSHVVPSRSTILSYTSWKASDFSKDCCTTIRRSASPFLPNRHCGSSGQPTWTTPRCRKVQFSAV